MSGIGNVLPGIPLEDQPMGVYLHGQTHRELRDGGLTPAAIASAVESGILLCVPLSGQDGEPEIDMYLFSDAKS